MDDNASEISSEDPSGPISCEEDAFQRPARIGRSREGNEVVLNLPSLGEYGLAGFLRRWTLNIADLGYTVHKPDEKCGTLDVGIFWWRRCKVHGVDCEVSRAKENLE
jgi:hypothetical protein